MEKICQAKTNINLCVLSKCALTPSRVGVYSQYRQDARQPYKRFAFPSLVTQECHLDKTKERGVGALAD